MLLKQLRHAAVLQADERGFGLPVVAWGEETPSPCFVASSAPARSRGSWSAHQILLRHLKSTHSIAESWSVMGELLWSVALALRLG